jgi:hypothetical protein
MRGELSYEIKDPNIGTLDSVGARHVDGQLLGLFVPSAVENVI